MSYYDYVRGRYIEETGEPFYAIVMAAMRRADVRNLDKLKAVFPDTWDELHARYNAPGGRLPGEGGAS